MDNGLSGDHGANVMAVFLGREDMKDSRQDGENVSPLNLEDRNVRVDPNTTRKNTLIVTAQSR